MSLGLQKPVLVKFQYEISVRVSGEHNMEHASKTRGSGNINRVFIDVRSKHWISSIWRCNGGKFFLFLFGFVFLFFF
jgi:hypothetical protein